MRGANISAAVTRHTVFTTKKGEGQVVVVGMAAGLLRARLQELPVGWGLDLPQDDRVRVGWQRMPRVPALCTLFILVYLARVSVPAGCPFQSEGSTNVKKTETCKRVRKRVRKPRKTRT